MVIGGDRALVQYGVACCRCSGTGSAGNGGRRYQPTPASARVFRLPAFAPRRGSLPFTPSDGRLRVSVNMDPWTTAMPPQYRFHD